MIPRIRSRRFHRPGSELAEIAVTDTVRVTQPLPSKLSVLSVADVLAETIANVVADRIVLARFAGQELF